MCTYKLISEFVHTHTHTHTNRPPEILQVRPLTPHVTHAHPAQFFQPEELSWIDPSFQLDPP